MSSPPFAPNVTNARIIRPIDWVDSRLNMAKKRRVRPVPHPLDVTMLERIDVDIVDMGRVVRIVPDGVLPEAPLPDAPLVAPPADLGSVLDLLQGPREMLFDRPPAFRVIVVSGWECPDRVQVVRKHDPRVDVKRTPAAYAANGVSELGNVSDQQIIRVSLEQVHREKIRAARYADAAIVGHFGSMSFGAIRFAIAPYKGADGCI
jgi:hypothetical protein